MRKVISLVAVLLMGITTQAFSNLQINVDTPSEKIHRYSNSQHVQFMEAGVLYVVNSRGSFDFKFTERRNDLQNRRINYSNPRNQNNGNRSCGTITHNQIATDYYGNIIRIGTTQIRYNRYGQAKAIGSVKLRYDRSRLIQVGTMDLVYNRFGKIRSTYGIVNRYNKQEWHDDWYVYNEDDHYYGNPRRIRS